MALGNRTPMTEAWMAHTVRELEQAGPLDDAQAMVQAFRLHTSAQARLRERAWLLGQRLGLDVQMARWRDGAWLLGAALALAVVLIANGIVFAMLTDGRTINAGSAFVAALGVHALTLVLWLGALLVAQRGMPGAWSRLSLGKLLLQLLARLPLGRGQYSLSLAGAASQMLQQSRLAPWAFGLVSHLVWVASFVLVLLGLLLAFAFREYRLTWETTILSPGFFDAFVRATGWLPGVLGLPVPDGTSHPTTPGTLAVSARSAALWLLGCVAVYGLLPRLLCAAVCAAVWRRRKGRIQLDTSDPYFRQLLARFDAMEPPRITDSEQPWPGLQSAALPLPAGSYRPALALIGFELAEAQEWPPHPLAGAAALVKRIDGSVPARQAVLDDLTQLRPQALVLVCNAASTPDRGTERFLREACSHAQHCALWLAAPPAGRGAARPERWRHWLDALHLPDVASFDEPTQAQEWAVQHHGQPD